MQHFLKIAGNNFKKRKKTKGTVKFESSKKFASSQVQNFEILNLDFEISKLLFATQRSFGEPSVRGAAPPFAGVAEPSNRQSAG